MTIRSIIITMRAKWNMVIMQSYMWMTWSTLVVEKKKERRKKVQETGIQPKCATPDQECNFKLPQPLSLSPTCVLHRASYSLWQRPPSRGRKDWPQTWLLYHLVLMTTGMCIMLTSVYAASRFPGGVSIDYTGRMMMRYTGLVICEFQSPPRAHVWTR